ncbi:hypothetical protein QJS66_11085 [Kocuria rhizophila]|nr:hypothetical protein QJS66_11085 [Kocuria rhizophila]
METGDLHGAETHSLDALGSTWTPRTSRGTRRTATSTSRASTGRLAATPRP